MVLLLVIIAFNLFSKILADDCIDCYCQRVITECCDDECIEAIEPYQCPEGLTFISPIISTDSCNCVEDFISSFPTFFDSLLVSNPININSYVTGQISVGNNVLKDVPFWCIDYEHELFSGYVYNETVTYPYTEIIATPSLAENLAQPSRLNQIAWILNNIPVGSTASGPQTWNGVTYSECGEISVSDIQTVFWALSSPQGQCDGPSSLCTESIGTVNVCNAAYIWNTVFFIVPDGSSYIVSGPGSYIPIVVVPADGHQVLITKWATNCQSNCSDSITPTIQPTVSPSTCKCLDNFIKSFPNTFDDLVVSSPIEEYTYVKGVISINSEIYGNVDLWCIDYEHELFSGYVYNETVTYPYTEIIATPSLAENLAQPSRLNQIAWILNNIPVGSLATGPQTWNGVTYSECGEISVSDIQTVFWALSSLQGQCDGPSSLCTESIGTVNVCNAAYIWNTVFFIVPDGSSYIVSGPGSYIPIVVVPADGHQVLITRWVTNCDC